MHMQADHLELYALGELPEQLSSAVESHLKTCVDCGIQFEESRQSIGEWLALAEEFEYAGPENRRNPRVPTNDPATLTELKQDRSPRIKVRIVDTSKEGMKLQVPHELMAGTVVQVRLRDLFILAEVRYCISAGKLFHAGVHIQDVFSACG